MAYKKISQVEAWSLRHQVKRLKKKINDMRQSWAKDWPDGVLIHEYVPSDVFAAKLSVAKSLNHAVVANYYNGNVYFYAMPVAEEK